MKKLEIGMVIQAIDKVTGPAKGITASIRRMAAQSEKAVEEAHTKSHGAHKKHAHKHGHSLGEEASEGFQKALGFGGIAEMIPEVAVAAGLVGGIEGVVEGFKKLTEASDEARAAQARLSIMMMHVKGTTKEDVDSVNELAEKLEGTTAYKHTIFEMAASQLAAFGMNGKQIKSMLPVMADYLAMQNGVGATNEDAIAGAKLLGKAYAGNVGALRRAGVVFSAAQEAILKHGTAAQRTAVLIKGIEGKAGGLAARQLLDPKAQIQQANNIFETIKEKLGDALTPIRLAAMHALSGALPYINKFADDLPKMLSRGGGALQKVGGMFQASFGEGFKGANIDGATKAFSSIGGVMMKVVGPIIPLWMEVQKFLSKVLGEIAKWFVDLWVNAQPGLKAIVESLAPIIDALGNLWHKILLPLWQNVFSPFLGWLIGKFVPFLINILGPGIKLMATAVGWVLNGIINLISGLFSWLGKVWPIVAKFFVTLWARIKNVFGVLKQILTSIWMDIWDSLFKWVSEKWGAFLDIFKKVGNFLGFGGSSPVAVGNSGGAPVSSAYPPLAIGNYGVGPTAMDRALHGNIHISTDPGVKVKMSGSARDLFHSDLGQSLVH